MNYHTYAKGFLFETSRFGMTNFATMMASRDRRLRMFSPLGAYLGIDGSTLAFPFLGAFFLVEGL
jgi:hypothetical protein